MSKISELLNRAVESFYKTMDTLQEHIAKRDNPHGVTKEQIGLGNVQNVKAAPADSFNAHRTAAVLDHPDGSVTEQKLAKGAVTAPKIQNGAVTPEKIYGNLPIEKGGTGADTPEGAREALGAMAQSDGDKMANNQTLIKNTSGGFAAGHNSEATTGGAVGKYAMAGAGFAGGYAAETISPSGPVDAIQLGSGNNMNEGTMQVYSYKLLDEKGNIPPERLENSQLIKRYGVRFSGGANSGQTVRRLYNAEGLVSIPGTDTEQGYSDFDNIYPWCGRKRCCGYFKEDGVFVVNAYEGEPGYAVDGSAGDVWVETPLFYYRHINYDDGSEEICISSYPLEGYLPSPAHINADGTLRQKVYTGAYALGLVDDVPVSRSGVATIYTSLNGVMSKIREKKGAGYRVTTMAEYYMRSLLMWVEFGTRDLQSVMKGGCTLSSFTSTITVEQTGANSIIVKNAYAQKLMAGQCISIGTLQSSGNKGHAKIITDIVPYDTDNSYIYFSGDPVDSDVGNYVCSAPWHSGMCDGVLGSSGSYISNTSGKYPCIYRGEENPYGGGRECISDVTAVRKTKSTESGTEYEYYIYYLPDTSKFTGVINSDYVMLDYKLCNSSGDIKGLGLDKRYPFIRLPVEVGGSTSTYYADSYVKPSRDTVATYMGGSPEDSIKAGAACAYFSNSMGAMDVRAKMRMSYQQ